jgi:hypothetical protein
MVPLVTLTRVGYAIAGVVVQTGGGRSASQPLAMSAILLSAAAARRRMAGCPSGQRERSVKPSAQPTLVRTQHLPLTWDYGPLAADSRRWRAVFLCPGVGHLVALWTVMLRCPRTHGGRAPVRLGRSVCSVAAVGVHRRRFHGRPRTAALTEPWAGVNSGAGRASRLAGGRFAGFRDGGGAGARLRLFLTGSAGAAAGARDYGGIRAVSGQGDAGGWLPAAGALHEGYHRA